MPNVRLAMKSAVRSLGGGAGSLTERTSAADTMNVAAFTAKNAG